MAILLIDPAFDRTNGHEIDGIARNVRKGWPN